MPKSSAERKQCQPPSSSHGNIVTPWFKTVTSSGHIIRLHSGKFLCTKQRHSTGPGAVELAGALRARLYGSCGQRGPRGNGTHSRSLSQKVAELEREPRFSAFPANELGTAHPLGGTVHTPAKSAGKTSSEPQKNTHQTPPNLGLSPTSLQQYLFCCLDVWRLPYSAYTVQARRQRPYRQHSLRNSCKSHQWQ